MQGRIEDDWKLLGKERPDQERGAVVGLLWPGIRHGRRPPLLRHPVSEEEYLAREEHSDTKHEYVDGFIYAMAGASDAHVTIVLNLAASIHALLRGRRCKGYVSDMKVAIPRPEGSREGSRGTFYYPDGLITCSEADLSPSATMIKREPRVVFEVLSPDSTETTDRTEKLDNYRRIPTLEQYWLIAQDEYKVVVCSRNGEEWQTLEHTNPATMIPLPIDDLAIRLGDLYDKVFGL